MIDINTIIQQALEKAITEAVNNRMQAITEAVNNRMQDMDASFEAVDRSFSALSQRVTEIQNRPFSNGLQEMIVAHATTYLEDHLHVHLRAPLGQLRAQFAEDINAVARGMDDMNIRLNRDLRGLGEILSGMQERFALKDVVEENYREAASSEALNEVALQLNKLCREVKDLAQGPDIDSDDLADTILDLFSDGTLTITIDKV